MMMKSKSKEKYERGYIDRTHSSEENAAVFRQNKNEYEGSKLSQLEDKMRGLNQLDAVEEGLLKDINNNNQRLENIINSIKSLMKVDQKAKRSSVSPITKATQHRGTDRDKSNKRLIERVQKAISGSDNQHFSK